MDTPHQRRSPMAPLFAVLGITALFVVLALVIARVDGLALLAPRSTQALRASAHGFCADRCRADGLCPLTGGAERGVDCPLWKYVAANVPTTLYGSPFEPGRA